MTSPSLRVVLVHKDFEPHRGGGGTARHMHGLASALADNGCEVRVVAPDPEDIATPYRTYAIKHWREMADHIGWSDVVHVNGARSLLAFHGARMAWRSGKPFFYTPHCWYKPRSSLNAISKTIWDQTAERFMLTHCAKTIILTDYWRDYLAQHFLPSDRTVVIPNCVLQRDLKIKPRIASHDPHGSDPLFILSVGRLSPEKRGRDVIAALAEPALKQARLDIAGKGPDRPALEAIASRLGVADRVSFLGFVSDEDLADRVARSDVFVLASEEEGLPTILLEMILAKIPIVCTRIAGNLAITDVAGIDATYEVGDIVRLADLLAHPQSIDRSVMTAVENTFTWEKIAPKVLDAYRASLTGTRHTTGPRA